MDYSRYKHSDYAMDKDSKTYDYDAYMCFAPADKDRTFVNMLADILETAPFNLKLFIPERDIKGDLDEIELSKIITERCRKFVVILTNEFLKDNLSDYLLKLTFSSKSGWKRAKIIPVIVEYCKMPKILRHICNCDFTKTELYDWLIPRLASSIKNTCTR